MACMWGMRRVSRTSAAKCARFPSAVSDLDTAAPLQCDISREPPVAGGARARGSDADRCTDLQPRLQLLLFFTLLWMRSSCNPCVSRRYSGMFLMTFFEKKRSFLTVFRVHAYKNQQQHQGQKSGNAQRMSAVKSPEFIRHLYSVAL